MTAEEELFLTLLRNYVQGEKSTLPDAPVNWETLYSIAERQALLGVCYIQLRGLLLPKEELDRFHRGFFGEVYYAANRGAEMQRLTTCFREHGIAFLPFKGWIVKECWPSPALRTMGDVDILIRSEDRQASDELMRLLGYDCFVDNQAVWTYSVQDMFVEIHDHMFYEHLGNQIDYEAYFDGLWNGTADTLDEGAHLLYLITHMAKHITNKGLGFRAFLDLVFFMRRNREKIDIAQLEQEAEKLELLSFMKRCYAFCASWFQESSPFEEYELDPAFYRFVTEKMFQDGLFGLDNEQNEASHSAKEIRHSAMPYWLGAIKVTLYKIFPPYRDMQLIPWYSFVDGRPWLLPFAWIYRWGYCLIKKRKASEDLLAEPFVKRTQIDERNRRMAEWGL